MPQRQLREDRVVSKAKPILEKARRLIDVAAGRSSLLRFKINRYVYKQLSYDERGKPAHRKLLKLKKYQQQNKVCTWCHKQLRQVTYTELDRKVAWKGYTEANTDLIHAKCHQAQQRQRRYQSVSS